MQLPRAVLQGAVPDRELVVHRLELIVHRLELLVGRAELLVGRLQLLDRRLELLVGRLQLLVRGLKFFVGRLQLLVGGLELLVRGLEVVVRILELFLEVVVVGDVDERDHRADHRAVLGREERRDEHVQVARLGVATDRPDVLEADLTAVAARAVDVRTELDRAVAELRSWNGRPMSSWVRPNRVRAASLASTSRPCSSRTTWAMVLALSASTGSAPGSSSYEPLLRPRSARSPVAEGSGSAG